MNKENSVAFIDLKLKEEFEDLSKGRFEDKQLHDSIAKSIDELKNNPETGTKISRKLWPKIYIKQHSITNLWKYNLPNGWRLFYIIEANEIKIMSIIL